uniref:RING-type domain-containing protein n=1 Tax=Glossina pallidipes TaxID=7398 RepID=A0A1A9ZKN1_GLOPL
MHPLKISEKLPTNWGDLHSIRRLLEHDTSDAICPTCRISFDKGKRRKLIDTCGHERCYSCMFRNDQCPMCMKGWVSLKKYDAVGIRDKAQRKSAHIFEDANNELHDYWLNVDGNNAQGYDTGIGGSTSTIVSPLGSPQPQLRSQVQRTNATALARYMQITNSILLTHIMLSITIEFIAQPAVMSLSTLFKCYVIECVSDEGVVEYRDIDISAVDDRRPDQ